MTPISQKDFLKKITEALNRAGIPYMLSGSVTSSLFGRPRATNDIDIVIDPTEKQLLSFAESLGEDFYVSMAAVKTAFANNSMFNVIDVQAGWKADFIIRKDRPFSDQEFQRRQNANIMGLNTWTTSPEDIILTKLEWAANSHSEQQLQDAIDVAVVQWDQLDRDYLHTWAKELHIESSLKQLLKRAKTLLDSK